MAVKTHSNVESELWGDVEIICPICRTRNIINIPKRVIDESKQLTSIFIPIGRICDHAFIPFIDKQFKVRGYQKLDALLDDIESKTEAFDELKPEIIDVIEIKMNIKPEMVIYAIHGCIFKQKMVLITENKLNYLKETIFDFFDYIFQKSFEIDILIQTKDEFKKNRKSYDSYLKLAGKDIVGKTKNVVNIDGLKIEENLVRDFYMEGDSISGLRKLRDKLRQTYALTFKLIEFYKKHGIEKPLNVKRAIRYLEDTHFLKIKKSHFQLLVDVAINYFGTNIILVQDKIGEKLEQMWGL